MAGNGFLFLFTIIFGVIPSLKGHIGEYDDVWQKRAEEAKKASMDAYHPNPEEITFKLNEQVHL